MKTHRNLYAYSFTPEARFQAEKIDELMSQIPGKNNYPGESLETLVGLKKKILQKRSPNIRKRTRFNKELHCFSIDHFGLQLFSYASRGIVSANENDA